MFSRGIKREFESELQAFEPIFFEYVDGIQSESELYKVFTYVTILRIKLDKHDHFITNYFENNQLAEQTEIKGFIKEQYVDIESNTKKRYSVEVISEVKSTLTALMPRDEKKTLWSKIIEFLQNAIDNIGGKK